MSEGGSRSGSATAVLANCHSAYKALALASILLLILGLASRPKDHLQEALHELQDTKAFIAPSSGMSSNPFGNADEASWPYYKNIKRTVSESCRTRVNQLLKDRGFVLDMTPGGPEGLFVIEDSKTPTPISVFGELSHCVHEGTVAELLTALEFKESFFCFEPIPEDVERVLQLNATNEMIANHKANYIHFDVSLNDKEGRPATHFVEGLAEGFLWMQQLERDGKSIDFVIPYPPPAENTIHGLVKELRSGGPPLRQRLIAAQFAIASPFHEGMLRGPYAKSGVALPAVREFLADVREMPLKDAIVWMKDKLGGAQRTFSAFGVSFDRSEGILVGPLVVCVLMWVLLVNMRAAIDCSDNIKEGETRLTWIGTQRSLGARVLFHLTAVALPLVAVACVAKLARPPVAGWFMFVIVLGTGVYELWILWKLHKRLDGTESQSPPTETDVVNEPHLGE